MRYRQDAPGDWGNMQETETVRTSTEKLVTPDGCKLFLRSWQTDSLDVLLLLHGLGAHSGWFIDMGNELAASGINVYAMDHRGFGRSEGLAGHIDNHQTYVEDIAFVVSEVRERHPQGRIYLLGHSMGSIFVSHFAVKCGNMLAGVLFLNPWIEDSTSVPLGTLLSIFVGGMGKSRRAWQVAGGHENMTTNPEAVRMLQEDSFWRRSQTATFLVQLLFMRLAVLKKARQITLPALVLQAEADKSVIATASRKFYETLASGDKIWITYPNYAHDSELEEDRSQMDKDIANWIREHSAKKS